MIDERKLIKYLRCNKYQFVLNVREEKILDKIIKVIDEQPKLENTAGFKHFKLYIEDDDYSKDELKEFHNLYRKLRFVKE